MDKYEERDWKKKLRSFFAGNAATHEDEWLEIPGDVDRNDPVAMKKAIDDARLARMQKKARKRYFG